MMKQAAITFAPSWRKSFTAPSAVPPVAMRSSTRMTRSPFSTASLCISISYAVFCLKKKKPFITEVYEPLPVEDDRVRLGRQSLTSIDHLRMTSHHDLL